MKWRLGRTVGAVLIAASLVSSGIGLAEAAPTTTKPIDTTSIPANAKKIKKVKTTTLKAPGSGGGYAVSPQAVPSCFESRFISCGTYSARMDQYVQFPGAQPVFIGAWTVNYVLTMTSTANSGQVTVGIVAGVTATQNPIPGIWHLYLSYADSNQSAGSQFKQFDLALGTGTQTTTGQGTFTPGVFQTYSDRTDLLSRWDDTTLVPPINPPPGTIVTGQQVRCDNVASGASIGCVNPRFLPTVNMSQLPKVSANIRNAFSRGKPSTLTKFSPGRPANYRAACGNALLILGPPPNLTDISCDEYPFASSREGGAGSTIAWVPVGEQNSQGGTLSSFYQTQRVLDDDKFKVTA